MLVQFAIYRIAAELAHAGRRHRVANQGARQLVLNDFKRRQPRSLVIRSGFARVHLLKGLVAVQAAHDAEGGAVACRGQRPEENTNIKKKK